jgi:hypothetical protein
MEEERTAPTAVIYAILFSACTNMPKTDIGKQFHSKMTLAAPAFLQDTGVLNALIGMYMKYGDIEQAVAVSIFPFPF